MWTLSNLAVVRAPVIEDPCTINSYDRYALKALLLYRATKSKGCFWRCISLTIFFLNTFYLTNGAACPL
jgi:hypothetical protein